MVLEMIDPSLMPFVTTFFFVFAVAYGVLVNAKIMPEKNLNIIIAIILAIVSASYKPVSDTLQNFMPVFAVVLVLLFFLILVKKITSKKKNEKEGSMFPTITVLGILLLVLGLLWNNISSYIPYGFDTDNILWTAGIIIVLLLFYFAYKYKEK